MSRRKKKPKASASRLACALPWCCALAEPDGVNCAVHRVYPTLRLEEGDPLSVGKSANPECDSCEGSGECAECSGSGEHRCECGHEHDCEHCDGKGKCPDCDQEAARDRKEREEDMKYLRFAFDPGWQPFDADREYEAMNQRSRAQ